jgi:hypothetical protein
MNNHIEHVLAYLEQNKQITAANAYEKFGCMRLAAVIKRLRNRGYEITTTLEKSANYNPVTGFGRYAVYTLLKK